MNVRKSMDQKLTALRAEEAKLKARRRSLEVLAARDTKRLETRRLIVLGSALTKLMDENETARSVIPDKLRPYIPNRDRWVVEPSTMKGDQDAER